MQSTSGDDVVSAPPWDMTVGGLGFPTVPLFTSVAHVSHPETTRRFESPAELTQYAIHKGMPRKEDVRRGRSRGKHDAFWPTYFEIDIYKGIRAGGGGGLLPIPHLCSFPIPDDPDGLMERTGHPANKAAFAEAQRNRRRDYMAYRQRGVGRRYNPDFVLTAFDAEGDQFAVEVKSEKYFTKGGMYGRDPAAYIEKILAWKRAYPFFKLVLFCDIAKEAPKPKPGEIEQPSLQRTWDLEKIPYRVDEVYDEYVQVSAGALTRKEGRRQAAKAKQYIRDLRSRPGVTIVSDINELVVRMQRVWTTMLMIEHANLMSEGRRIPGLPAQGPARVRA